MEELPQQFEDISQARGISIDSRLYGTVCRGPEGCGAVVHIQDQDRHRRWHAKFAQTEE